MKRIFFLLLTLITFASTPDNVLLDLKVGDRYEEAKLHNLNHKPYYYGVNTVQFVFISIDTSIINNDLFTIATYKRYITFRKVDSLIIRIIDDTSMRTTQK